MQLHAARGLCAFATGSCMREAGDDEIKLTRDYCRLGIPENFEGSQRDMKG